MTRPGREPRRADAPSRAGFTLVELLVVLTILAIAAAAAAPALRTGEGTAGAAADTLARVWTEARGTAVRRGVPVAVVLEVPAGRWATVAEPGGGVPPETLRAGVLPLPEGASLAGGARGRAVARFDALGRARADRVLVLGGDAGRHEVTADAWTGDGRARAF